MARGFVSPLNQLSDFADLVRIDLEIPDAGEIEDVAFVVLLRV